jgi:hypothetical protein
MIPAARGPDGRPSPYSTSADAAYQLDRFASVIRNLIAAGCRVPARTCLFRKSDLNATHALHLERR